MGKYKHRKPSNKKKIKQTYMEKFSSIVTDCLLVLPILLIVFVATLILFLTDSPVNSNDLTSITGELQYYRVVNKRRGGHIAIGLKGKETEYRLASAYKWRFDHSFNDEVSVGDIITIYIDKSSNDKEFSAKGVDKKKYNYFYGLKTKGKVYFSYDDYLKSFNNGKNFAKGAMIFSILLIISVPVTIGVSYYVCKKKDESTHIKKWRKL